MNKHIELVKRWLTDPKSITIEELKANAEAADAAQWAAKSAAEGAAMAAMAAEVAAANAAYWVRRYEEMNNE